jgi:hypothetical protein
MNTKSQTDPLIVFVHVPKAGGMSLTRLLTETFGERLLHANPEKGWPPVFSDAVLADISNKRFFYKAYTGHYVYGIHQLFGRRARYFSVVREPLERLESYYNFVKRCEVHRYYRKAQELDIDSFFQSLIDTDDIEISNLQCLMIAGDEDPDLALQRAEQDFELIIPLPRVNDGISLLCDKLGIGRRQMPEENVTAHASKMTSLRKSVYDKIVELNRGDARLYAQVCEKFGRILPTI